MLLTTREFLKIIIKTLPIADPIYEFGSYLVPGQENEANLRPLFPKKKYFGCDMREGNGVDLVLNLHNIDLPSNIAGTVLSFDTLEHVEYPGKAVEEIHRILRPGGMIAITSVMNFPIHEFPHDYWRFTPQGLTSLLKIFDKSIVTCTGEDNFPISILGVGFKGAVPDLKKFEAKLNKWREKNLKIHRYLVKNNIKIDKI